MSVRNSRDKACLVSTKATVCLVSKAVSRVYIILLLCIWVSGSVYAQKDKKQEPKGKKKSKTELINKRERTERQIKLTNKLLSETKGKRERSLNELALLNKQIRLRNQLVNTLTEEISYVNTEIENLNSVVAAMEKDIENIQQNYGKVAQLTYQSFSEDNFWLAVFSAKDLSEVYNRTLYFRQFSEYRKRQIELIKRSKSFLEETSRELQKSLEEKNILIEEKSAEVEKLQSTRVEQNDVYVKLKKKEKEYRTRLANNKRALRGIIKTLDKKHGGVKQVENDATGKSFEKNKTFLSWPVSSKNSVIIERFGVTTDPYGNRIKNDGVSIRTKKGEIVRSIFKGTVTGVQKVPRSGYMVVVKHGIYRSVYANLAAINVKKGSKVTAKQQLGVVRADKRSGESVLNFLIYKIPNSFEDPQTWIVKDK